MCFSPSKNSRLKPSKQAEGNRINEEALANDIETGRLMTSQYYTSMLKGQVLRKKNNTLPSRNASVDSSQEPRLPARFEARSQSRNEFSKESR